MYGHRIRSFVAIEAAVLVRRFAGEAVERGTHYLVRWIVFEEKSKRSSLLLVLEEERIVVVPSGQVH